MRGCRRRPLLVERRVKDLYGRAAALSLLSTAVRGKRLRVELKQPHIFSRLFDAGLLRDDAFEINLGSGRSSYRL